MLWEMVLTGHFRGEQQRCLGPGLPRATLLPQSSQALLLQSFPEHDLWFLLGGWVVSVLPFLDFVTCGCERLCPAFPGPLRTPWPGRWELSLLPSPPPQVSIEVPPR